MVSATRCRGTPAPSRRSIERAAAQPGRLEDLDVEWVSLLNGAQSGAWSSTGTERRRVRGASGRLSGEHTLYGTRESGSRVERGHDAQYRETRRCRVGVNEAPLQRRRDRGD